jgi:peptidoglycan/LPS O-acetylase OafA/YrhL
VWLKSRKPRPSARITFQEACRLSTDSNRPVEDFVPKENWFQTHESDGIKKWLSIEGLRAWLAWIVVIGHCVQAADITNPHWIASFYEIGQPTVMVFVIISGFVITHLIVEKQEPYLPYIVRRFMRLYPLFVVACAAGAVTLPLYVEGLSRVTWTSEAEHLFAQVIASQSHYAVAHIVAHATMLHGMVPVNILPFSSLAFCPPAWSISLEWQFYLLAPVLVMLAAKGRNGAAFLLVVCWIFGRLYFYGHHLREYLDVSFLPITASFFAVGIASRLAWPKLGNSISRPSLIIAGALAIAPLGNAFFDSILVWVSFFALLCVDHERAIGIDRIAVYIRSGLFENRFALFWGSRSYSVYLCHFPVLGIVVYTFANDTISQWSFFYIVTFSTLIITAVVTPITYKYIELPGILIGNMIASTLIKPRIAKIS